MGDSKPETVDEYRKWFCEVRGVEKTSMGLIYYESVSNKIFIEFQNSDFWQQLPTRLERLDQKYFLETRYHLLTSTGRPDLKIKPFESFFDKTFRKNIIENSNWPNEPEGGWLVPGNWYTRINDIVRTMFVVKYLDGVTFFVENLSSILSEFGMVSKVDFEAREEGYYAAHLYTEYECEIPRENWDTRKIAAEIEMQITTQLQEVIKNLLHTYYEAKRIRTKAPMQKWQWNYKSEEFATNYLGHILHYVEGMIMDIREKQKEKLT